MSKPDDDVPQDVWDVAGRLARSAANKYLMPTEKAEAIARAILAAEKRGEEREREACAQVANDAVFTPISDGDKLSSKKDAAFYMAAKIMRAIRKRGEG